MRLFDTIIIFGALIALALVVAGLLAGFAIAVTHWIEERREVRRRQDLFNHHQRRFE